ncbi:hypothetical protein BN946_scf184548.g2 [Trametes cinnabarina]|uniref:Transcription factor BYE1 n=1 Tax=Pycnoporus cinnabarinus TaxID=5643 RepID=A0A060SNL5_PYCCI|nr:hypothetical protein BN946_scf184548.g2 [Trametes cinnabarina]
MTTRAAARARQLSRTEPLSQEGESIAQDEKENVKMNGSSGKSRVTRKSSKVYCICKKPDDGSPMIHCASCKDWFHFRCVELSEKDAEEIQEWEGPDAVKEVIEDHTPAHKASSSTRSKRTSRKPTGVKKEEPDSDPSSDGTDEYDPQADTGTKRRSSRQAHDGYDSDSEESQRAKSPKRLRRGSVPPKEATPKKQSSPSPSVQSKRKKSITAQPQPPAKRPRSESTAVDDAVRKYCLGKLQELFCQIFMRYPFLNIPEEGTDIGELHPDKKPEELTQEEKEELEARAKQFGADLEQCMYELYAEPDKQGKHVAAGKYKERFRMLTFNLSKADRVVLHMRIASSRISPKELSTMSSTDLASEEEKQSIKKLEEESLAHSILKKSIVPRAKLTHKGLQDIEDVTGAGQREAEREREEEEEERIERERLARLRQQAQRAQSQGSAPPESPVVPQTPTWGGPPPVPPHAASAADPSSSSAVSMGRPLFVPSASDFAATGPVENELNLADLINIDEEPSGEVAMTPVDAVPTPFGSPAPLSTDSKPEQPPELQSRPSFDLNALWTPSPAGAHTSEQAGPAQPQESSQPMPVSTELAVEAGLAPETEDQDFDMFLSTNDQEPEQQEEAAEVTPAVTETKEVAFEDRAPVWSGTLSMPLDSAIPQEVGVTARQGGGRTLPVDSPLWHTLFPSNELRIDGRVPVEKSAQYLTQVRLNPTKELIAAVFSAAPNSDPSGFHAIKNHLLSKGRHGLIFPWGHNPKSSAPGRELYMVPLLSTDPIPEYMELLDQLQLPPTRNTDYLVGIWVLTKGKLTPPPNAPATAAVAPTSLPGPAAGPAQQPSAAPVIPNFDFAQLQQLGLLSQPSQPSHSPVPPTSTQSLLEPAVSMPPPQPTLTAPSSSNPAPDISQLTPEQIQLMLQTLVKTTQHISGQAPPAQLYSTPTTMPPHSTPPSQSVVPPQPIALPQAALQAWTSQAPTHPPLYPPQLSAPPPPYPSAPSAPPPHVYNPDGPYGERYDHNRPYPSAHDDYERGGYRGRGGRGGRGFRGRGGNWKARGRGGPSGGSAQRGRGRGGGW